MKLLLSYANTGPALDVYRARLAQALKASGEAVAWQESKDRAAGFRLCAEMGQAFHEGNEAPSALELEERLRNHQRERWRDPAVWASFAGTALLLVVPKCPLCWLVVAAAASGSVGDWLPFSAPWVPAGLRGVGQLLSLGGVGLLVYRWEPWRFRERIPWVIMAVVLLGLAWQGQRWAPLLGSAMVLFFARRWQVGRVWTLKS